MNDPRVLKWIIRILLTIVFAGIFVVLLLIGNAYHWSVLASQCAGWTTGILYAICLDLVGADS